MSSTPVVKQAVVGISLRLELNSQDGLRRVVFTLSKDVLANDKTRWKIGFELYERNLQQNGTWLYCPRMHGTA
jgi:hypothetical protein